jgi:hypothetical protein
VIRSTETCWNGRVATEVRGVRGGGGMGIHLVSLADSASRNKAVNEGIKARPPKVPGHEDLGAEDATMATGSRLMEGGDNVAAGPLGNIESPFEVQLPILVEPVLPAGVGEEGGSLVEGLEGGEHEGIRGGGQGDFVGKSDIDGMGEEVIRKECKLQVVIGRVNVVTVREGVSGTHLGARGVVEVQVKVLQ